MSGPQDPLASTARRPGRRIGIFGGTFDPVHVGHLVAAVNARHALKLDMVLLVVANEPWQKAAERPITPAADRMAVVEAAASSATGLVASAIEVERGGPSYTVDTVAELRRRGADDELFVIIGADVVGGLSTWQRIEEIADEATIVVVNRPGTPSVDPLRDERLRPFRAVGIEVPALEISSTDLRERAASGRPLDYLIPEAAVRAIAARGLYARRR